MDDELPSALPPDSDGAAVPTAYPDYFPTVVPACHVQAAVLFKCIAERTTQGPEDDPDAANRGLWGCQLPLTAYRACMEGAQPAVAAAAATAATAAVAIAPSPT